MRRYFLYSWTYVLTKCKQKAEHIYVIIPEQDNGNGFELSHIQPSFQIQVKIL